jgi:opacity protein-like surface antigen
LRTKKIAIKKEKKMAKKIVLGLLIAVIACGATFALPEFKLSAGGGGFFDVLFKTGKIGDHKVNSNAIGGGVYAFFDATYAEIDLDMLFNSQTDPDIDDFSMRGIFFGFSVLGKYPFEVGPVTLFPLVGIDYQMFLSGTPYYKDEAGDSIDRNDMSKPENSDLFSIAAGIGLDYPITDSLYIRGEFLWNFKLDDEDEAKARKDNDDYTVFTSGPRLKVGVGFKF